MSRSRSEVLREPKLVFAPGVGDGVLAVGSRGEPTGAVCGEYWSSSKAGTCRVSGKTAPIPRRRYLPERGTGGTRGRLFGASLASGNPAPAEPNLRKTLGWAGGGTGR